MKKYLVSAVLTAWVGTLSPAAIANDGVNIQALKACSFIENDFRRLLCYDNIMAGKPIDAMPKGEVKNTNAAPQSNKKAQAASVAGAPAKHSKANKADFGLEHKKEKEQKDDNNELRARVSQVDEAPYGELILTLDNGQKWRQIGTEHFRLNSNDTVIISRGMFNSFLLKKQGANKSIRVKRVD
ncbi:MULTISPECIES: hypothetical protein [Pseudoalteromonas]|uniref:Uncharacterized protein n=1 Tax=Pseudoalteromonas ruthenica TaxID=151081 RepID=A0A0F4PK85_9GAMM|nr:MULTISPECIES: hypothetical protein [Pseudoalteromonas]KJY95408.1 hypothetical protein TW76_15335 [Pseudoalteromonas ruthenica]KJY96978.1 hypothetical protein TW72_16040 [Pseudoalteromonas ruthenica]MCF2863882.1 hypothetical protein [Pseudoalteromonas sp. CNAT2-18]MCG7559803.1 hypothetical protein [Pseudoalteromonas sp. CNAT2-18.1]MCG7571751.1 hypothetical protein [Pseudoalteromonas sp. CNC9-20]